MSTPGGGAFRGLLGRPWHRAVVAELLAHDRVPVRVLLEHVPGPETRRRTERSKIYRDADHRHALAMVLNRLAEHGAVQLPGCLECGTVTVTDRMVLERVALLQANNPETNPKAARPAPSGEPDAVRPDADYLPDRIAGRHLRVVGGSEAS